jgi:imidazolonepropionase-like amidohydrolase
MRAFVQYCADQGLGSIKLVISGESALKPGSHGEVLYTEEEMDAAREATREHGLWIACHAYTDAAVDLALRAGARIIYHGSYISDAMVESWPPIRTRSFTAPAAASLSPRWKPPRPRIST